MATASPAASALCEDARGHPLRTGDLDQRRVTALAVEFARPASPSTLDRRRPRGGRGHRTRSAARRAPRWCGRSRRRSCWVRGGWRRRGSARRPRRCRRTRPACRWRPCRHPTDARPRVPTFTSLSIHTAMPSSASDSASPKPNGSCHPGRLGAWRTTPVATSTAPGAPTPTASTSVVPPSSATTAAIASTTPSGPPCIGVLRLASATTSSPLASTAKILVPPRSTPMNAIGLRLTALPRRSRECRGPSRGGGSRARRRGPPARGCDGTADRGAGAARAGPARAGGTPR